VGVSVVRAVALGVALGGMEVAVSVEVGARGVAVAETFSAGGEDGDRVCPIRVG